MPGDSTMNTHGPRLRFKVHTHERYIHVDNRTCLFELLLESCTNTHTPRLLTAADMCPSKKAHTHTLGEMSEN